MLDGIRLAKRPGNSRIGRVIDDKRSLVRQSFVEQGIPALLTICLSASAAELRDSRPSTLLCVCPARRLAPGPGAPSAVGLGTRSHSKSAARIFSVRARGPRCLVGHRWVPSRELALCETIRDERCWLADPPCGGALEPRSPAVSPPPHRLGRHCPLRQPRDPAVRRRCRDLVALVCARCCAWSRS